MFAWAPTRRGTGRRPVPHVPSGGPNWNRSASAHSRSVCLIFSIPMRYFHSISMVSCGQTNSRWDRPQTFPIELGLAEAVVCRWGLVSRPSPFSRFCLNQNSSAIPYLMIDEIPFNVVHSLNALRHPINIPCGMLAKFLPEYPTRLFCQMSNKMFNKMFNKIIQ